MIKFRISLQDRPNELPAKVAVWLLERNDRYPDVEFKVECYEIRADEADRHKTWQQRFSRMIVLRNGCAPLTVMFPYPKQNWCIRIIGNLTARERIQIAQMPKVQDCEKVSSGEASDLFIIGVPLESGETPNDTIEFVPVEPDMYMTGLVITGAELLDITHGERTEHKDAIIQAMSKKDWDTAKKLLKQRH